MPDRNEVVGSPLRVRGELDLHALRAQDSSGLLDGIDRAVVWDIKMTTRFRGIARRDGVLLHGGAGWGEVAPFWNYGLEDSASWLAAGLEWALAGATGLINALGNLGGWLAPNLRTWAAQSAWGSPEAPNEAAGLIVLGLAGFIGLLLIVGLRLFPQSEEEKASLALQAQDA